MRNIKTIFLIALGILLGTAYSVHALSVSTWIQGGTNNTTYSPNSFITSNGLNQFVATSSNPLYVGSIFATSTTATSTLKKVSVTYLADTGLTSTFIPYASTGGLLLNSPLAWTTVGPFGHMGFDFGNNELYNATLIANDTLSNFTTAIQLDDSSLIFKFGAGQTDTYNIQTSGIYPLVSGSDLGSPTFPFHNIYAKGDIYASTTYAKAIITGDLKALSDTTHEIDVRRTTTSIVKSIAGTGDINPSGDFNNATNLNYKVEITTGGELGTALFRWSDTGGVSWNASGLTTSSFYTLNHNIVIQFGSGSGTDFNTNDYITFTALAPASQVQTFIANTTNNRVGIGTSSPYATLSVAGQVVGAYFTGTTTATSTFGGGVNIATGCFSINNTCVGGGGTGSGTVGSGTTGQFPYYAANGTTLTATSSLFLAPTGFIGIGTTSPYAPLSMHVNSTDVNRVIFAIASSTPSATTSLFTVLNNGSVFINTAPTTFQPLDIRRPASTRALLNLGDTTQTDFSEIILGSDSGSGRIVMSGNSSTFGTGNIQNALMFENISTGPIVFLKGNNNEIARFSAAGNFGIGTTSPYAPLSVYGQVVASYYTATSTATSTYAGGISISSGCFAIGNTCIGAGGAGSGTVTSVATNNGLTGGTITTTGTVGLDISKLSTNALVSWDGTQLVATGTPRLTVGFITATSTTATSTFASDVNAQYYFSNGKLFGSAQGFDNYLIGTRHLGANITGDTNFFAGPHVGEVTTVATGNVLIGDSADQALTSGSYNICLGTWTCKNNITGNFNVAVGEFAGYQNTSASSSVFIGSGAGQGTVAYHNQNSTYIGYFAGNKSKTGSDNNTCIGESACFNITTGNSNIAIGYNVDLASSTTGSNQINIGNVLYGTKAYGGLLVSSAPTGGNIGIGTSTPAYTLDVWGDLRTQGEVQFGAATSSQENYSIRHDTNGDFTFQADNSYGYRWVDYAGSYGQPSMTLNPYGALNVEQSVTAPYFYGDGSGLSNLPASAWSLNGSDAYYTNGNVGIGTSNPNRPLYVLQDVTADIAYALKLDNPSTASYGSESVGVLFGVGGTGGSVDETRGKGAIVYTNDNSGYNRGDFKFLQNTTSDYSNPTLADTVLTITSGGALILNSSFAGNGDQYLCVDNSGTVGYSGGSCSPSSQRYKHDINPLQLSGLALLDELKPVSFEYNEGKGTKGTKWGFIAEQVASTSPELAVFNKDGQPETLDDRAISAVTVKAVQELSKEVELLKQEIEALKNNSINQCKI